MKNSNGTLGGGDFYPGRLAVMRQCIREFEEWTLRVVGGDEMGSLKSETVKYGRESQEALTRE
jgi:hypothetical protein